VEVVAGEPAKTKTGKLQKTVLRAAGMAPATWDREAGGYAAALAQRSDHRWHPRPEAGTKVEES
jgi:hypothetical protein